MEIGNVARVIPSKSSNIHHVCGIVNDTLTCNLSSLLQPTLPYTARGISYTATGKEQAK